MNVLSNKEILALGEALDDEYKSWATYDQVIKDFGQVRPFSNIRDAEARHIAALHELFTLYELDIPQNNWPGRVPRYAGLQQACLDAVSAEIENGEMYERLLLATQRSDILRVFRNLCDASQQRHLPAFQRCAQGGRRGDCGGGRRGRGFGAR